ncbi:BadF/BadG/BcrA/BcrD ATPase family protein [uncultured Propionibacterium sp.]|uniref:N-acetylglucosamine kinase n=1 Tax=uncultured Propionibacterium sp. TaxID=218066 RepID=UPI00292F783D|nr:BadF/BadG/BcrA/BcrD ATPase family protein [uncultured Propionibacterium sp.]
MSNDALTGGNEVVLCVDGGQTGTRAQLRCDGVPVAEKSYPGVVNDRPQIPQLAEYVNDALRTFNRPCPTASVGSSGLADDADPAELLSLVRSAGVKHVFLAHDSTTGYLCAVGDEPGVVVAAGTGVVTLAVGTGDVARVDGWGYLIGDAGSGYWIGRAAFDRVMRAHDGRGRATALTGFIEQDFPDLEKAYLELQADEHKVSRIASYARTVAGLATTDPVARAISTEAADELAVAALAGLHRVGQDERPDPAVGMLGQAFRNTVLRERFEELIRGQFTAARIIDASGNGLGGCFAMARLSTDSALRQRVHEAHT